MILDITHTNGWYIDLYRDREDIEGRKKNHWLLKNHRAIDIMVTKYILLI